MRSRSAVGQGCAWLASSCGTPRLKPTSTLSMLSALVPEISPR